MKEVLFKILKAEARLIILLPVIIVIAVLNYYQGKRYAIEMNINQDTLKILTQKLSDRIDEQFISITTQHSNRLDTMESFVKDLSMDISSYQQLTSDKIDQRGNKLQTSLMGELTSLRREQSNFQKKLNHTSTEILNTLNREIIALKTNDRNLGFRLDDQNDSISSLETKIKTSEAEFLNRIDSLKSNIDQIIPQGAIIAFNSSSNIPNGWEVNSGSKGRFIRGIDPLEKTKIGTIGGTDSNIHNHLINTNLFDVFKIEKNKVQPSDKVSVQSSNGTKSISTIKANSFSHSHALRRPNSSITIDGQAGRKDNRPKFVSYYYIIKK